MRPKGKRRRVRRISRGLQLSDLSKPVITNDGAVAQALVKVCFADGADFRGTCFEVCFPENAKFSQTTLRRPA